MNDKAVAFLVVLTVVGFLSIIDPAISEAFVSFVRVLFPSRVQLQ